MPSPVCLTIGGSDSCGGAGIQADLAIFARLGVSGRSAITALTAQNPERILRIEPSPPVQLAAELEAILSYEGVAAVKTGMLVGQHHIRTVADALSQHSESCPLVVDPVMVSTSGTALLDDAGLEVLTATLFPMASLITPNRPEGARLLGADIDDPVAAATALVRRFRCPVLLKGGHGEGQMLLDVLCMADGEIHVFEHPRLSWDRDQAHGSGCRLAAAITAFLGLGASMDEAVFRGIDQLQGAKA
jgi:hydroxymethylpyrimidine/phosphomethylpyrimidine kinase